MSTQLDPIEFFTIEDISRMYNIPKNTLKYRCQRLMLKPLIYNGHNAYVLSRGEVEEVFNYTNLDNIKIPEIIYVTRTVEILESKLNYTPENKL